MSNTRKIRRPDDDREREQRHMTWLNTAGNGDRLAAESKAAYGDAGRGFWFAADRDFADSTRMAYIPQGDIADMPAGRVRDVVASMVATYNPARQCVVVLDDDGRMGPATRCGAYRSATLT